jgi:hypothetical protein
VGTVQNDTQSLMLACEFALAESTELRDGCLETKVRQAPRNCSIVA